MTQLAMPWRVLTVAALAATLLTGCTSLTPWKSSMSARASASWSQPLVPGQERPETIVGVAADGKLVSFNAGTPDKLISKKDVTGLVTDERVITMDFAVSRNRLYTLTSLGRVMTLNPDDGNIVSLDGILKIAGRGRWSMDIDAKDQYLRMLEQTGYGQQVNMDDKTGGLVSTVTLKFPEYAPKDLLEGKNPRIVALGFGKSPSQQYAIDGNAGYLVKDHWDVVQGEFDAEGLNHRLNSIGSLGLPYIETAAMDIDRETGTAYLVASGADDGPSKFYEVNLETGQTRLIGTVGYPYRLMTISIRP
jgi:hypothetical protein